jgi:hypothetical protein
MSSIGKPSRWPSRIPAILVLTTVALGGVAAIPTMLIGGAEAVAMLAVGAGLGLFAVLGGYACHQLVFRGPDRYAAKIAVGGFLVRITLLILSLFLVVRLTGARPERFVLWLVSFYVILVMAEAWVLARANGMGEPRGRTR